MFWFSRLQDGSVQEEDLMSFLSDTDFTSLKKRPKTWKECILALRNEMTNHVVIRSTASCFSININVIDWNDVSTASAANNNSKLYSHDYNNKALQKRGRHGNYSTLVIRV